MSVTKERLEEMESRILDADREELISMANELDFWIGDAEDLNDTELGSVVESAISVAQEEIEIEYERCPEYELKTQNDLMDTLYFIKKKYVPKQEANREKFKEAFDDFFKYFRYSNLPSLEGTHYFYSITFAPKKFSIYISMMDMDKNLGTVNQFSYGLIYEKSVDFKTRYGTPILFTRYKGEYEYEPEW